MEVARRLERRTRKGDLVARLGGDEFTVVVTDFERPDRLGSLAAGILDALREPVVISGGPGGEVGGGGGAYRGEHRHRAVSR